MDTQKPPSPSLAPSPRHRLQELLAIPERQRSDEQWDEINELEIKLASGNHGNPDQGGQRNHTVRAGPPQPGGGGGGRGNKQSRRFHKKQNKGNAR